MQSFSDQEIKATFDAMDESEKELPVTLPKLSWEQPQSYTIPQEILITRITNSVLSVEGQGEYARVE
jgi:hypothetical protein